MPVKGMSDKGLVIKGYRVTPLLRQTGQEILDDNILGLAAQTAYYFFFSLFPLFLFLAPLLGLIGDKQKMVGNLVSQLGNVVPPEGLAMLRAVVEDVVLSPSAPGVMSAGALLAAWAASNVFTNLIDALNRAYDVDEHRPWWKKRLIALAAVAATGIIMLLATVVMLAGDRIVDWLAAQLALGAMAVTIWTTLQYPIAFALLVASAWLIYVVLPNVRQDRTQALVGAIAATVLWVLVTLLFRAYVRNFGSYNKTYGAIGGVIVMLTWMYLSMLVLLSGGELDAELHHGTGAVDARRGVTYGGRISTGTGPARASTDRVVRVGNRE